MGLRPILITYVGGQAWTVGESEEVVDYDIRHGKSILMTDSRPRSVENFDGVSVKFNYANVVACAAFPV